MTQQRLKKSQVAIGDRIRKVPTRERMVDFASTCVPGERTSGYVGSGRARQLLIVRLPLIGAKKEL